MFVCARVCVCMRVYTSHQSSDEWVDACFTGKQAFCSLTWSDLKLLAGWRDQVELSGLSSNLLIARAPQKA